MTLVDVEQLAGAITDKLAELFEEEPKKSHGRASLMPTPGGPAGPTMRKATLRSVAEPVR